MKPKAFFVVSRYKEPFEWIEEYTQDYLIYNKGDPIENPHVINTENIGGNQRDIFKFFYDNYNYLPELTAFIQANPFDHAKKEVFDKLIYNDHFTALEYYGLTPANSYEKRAEDGGFMEINNSWYVPAHNGTYHQSCAYPSLDVFMHKYFTNYIHLDFVRFAPGSQYIVEKRQALHYPRKFWQALMNELPRNNMTEAHIIERSLWMILQCRLEVREEYA